MYVSCIISESFLEHFVDFSCLMVVEDGYHSTVLGLYNFSIYGTGMVVRLPLIVGLPINSIKCLTEYMVMLVLIIQPFLEMLWCYNMIFYEP